MHADFLKKKWGLFRSKSPLGKLQSMLNFIPGRPIRFGVYCCFDAHLPLQNLRLPAIAHSIRECGVKDLPLILRLKSERSMFMRRFAIGEQCLVLLFDDTPAGYLWYSTLPFHTEETSRYTLAVPPNAVYVFDEFVSPEYRNKGVLAALFDYLTSNLQDRRNVMRVMIYTDNDNSNKVHINRGFRLVHRIKWVNILGMNRAWIEGLEHRSKSQMHQ